ncbi:MAG: hypothetical protein ACJ0DK_07500 [Planctomycetota bacterium]
MGKSAEAAEDLNRKYCEIRKEKDPQLRLKDCLRRGHSFADYVRDGGAGLNTRRGEHSEWSGFIITMSAKYPGPEEEDYKAVVLHEYFHIYQHAHIFSRKESERNSRNQVNPWWAEGGAEYMAQLLYSRQKGVRPGYLKEKMRQKLRSLKDLKKGESITDIPYGERAMIAYDLGTWFIAYLIDRTSEEAYLKGFYRDLNKEGFEGVFSKELRSFIEGDAGSLSPVVPSPQRRREAENPALKNEDSVRWRVTVHSRLRPAERLRYPAFIGSFSEF